MDIGIFGGDVTGAGGFDAVVEAARSAHADGFGSFWLPQIFGLDALSTLAVIGREVPGIELGTAVVPTYPRHPMVLAGQALTVQAASGGRLTLGIGLSHRIVIEQMFGYSFERPVRHMTEYLAALMPLLRQEQVAFHGEVVHAVGGITVPGAPPPPVLIAALGPRMLELAGREAAGTITWMVGPRTLSDHVVPTIAAAASSAGREPPRIVAAVPVCVTDDPAAVRERAARQLAVYGTLPSYRAMLDREGAAGPADIAVIGSAEQVRAGLERFADAGATTIVAAEIGADPGERDRTRELLRSLL